MSKRTPYCVVGYYFDPAELIEAAKKTRDRNFKNFDTFTPFPVHGIDEAMGIKPTKLPFISFAAGLTGFLTGFVLTVWTHLFSWTHTISAKPLLALPAYIPIMFELTVLLAGVTTVAAMFVYFLGLPNFSKKIFHPGITDDRFALAIEVDQPEQVEVVKGFLKEIRAQEIHAEEGSL